MKRILFSILALVLIGCVVTKQPSPVPNAAGCSCTITALGTTLVDSMNWTNPVTGHMGSGTTVIHPEFGSTCFIYTDSSINCTTNAPNVAFVSFVCKGTNMPYAVPIVLPVNCLGVGGTVTGDCDKCKFSATFTNGFWCNIYSPKK